MQAIHELDGFIPEWSECALTLGVFDGMHRGHQALVQRLRGSWPDRSRARVLVTYHPHPDLVLGKRPAEGAELFTYQEKLSIFQRFDLDAVVFLPFTPELARMTALRYLKEILLGRLRARRIIIGYDQRFGRGRKGDYQLLKRMSKRYRYKVERVRAVRYRGQIVSTSRIRSLLSAGDVKQAGRLLGHDYFATGMVVRGAQRGRDLGFPTANVDLPATKALPGRGVYACVAEWGAVRRQAMVNVGVKPTFGEDRLTVEAHLLDFNADLYGEQLRLHFRKRLRDERRFASIEELIAQLRLDQQEARRLRI